MSGSKPIRTALISVYHKDGLDDILQKLHEGGVRLLSTGGTHKYIAARGYPCQRVEDITTYPSILGGRVKTLHPKIFGGILGRRGLAEDEADMAKYAIPQIDLVVVDLYPFEQTVAEGAAEEDIIEKIDIGGVSLIRAAAKNFNDVAVIPSRKEYPTLLAILQAGGLRTSIEERRALAAKAFNVSSRYDTAIRDWFGPIDE